MTITKEQAARAEKLAWFLADFRRFCALLEINDKSGQRVPFGLNEAQRLYCANWTQRDVVLKPRQIGFTTLILALDVFRFLTIRGSRVVVVCQSMTGNAPVTVISSTIRRFFSCLKRAGLALNFSSENKNEWSLKDRDSTLRVIVAGASEASAAKVGRSGTITHLHLTETAFWEYATDTLNALLECVPGIQHGSAIVSECTANGASGAFYDQCKAAESGDSGYKLHFYPWFTASEYAVPLDAGEVIRPATKREERFFALGVTPEQLKWYRQKVAENGQERTDQEYPTDPETCFLASGRTFFDQAITKSLLESAPTEPVEKRLDGRLWIWKRPEPGRGYIIGADAAEGVGKDDSAAPILDWVTGEHVATILADVEPWDYASDLAATGYFYNTALIAVERENHGHAVLQALVHPPPMPDGTLRPAYPCLYVAHDQKLGWITSQVTRPVMLDDLKGAHSKALFKTPDRRLLEQMKVFIVPASGKPEAAPGKKDDLVMGAAIAWEVRQRGGWAPPPDETEVQPYERQW